MKSKIEVDERIFMEIYRRYEEKAKELKSVNNEIKSTNYNINTARSIGDEDKEKILIEVLKKAKDDRKRIIGSMKSLEIALKNTLTEEYALSIIKKKYESICKILKEKSDKYNEITHKRNEIIIEINNLPRTNPELITKAMEKKEKLNEEMKIVIKERSDAEEELEIFKPLVEDKSAAYKYLINKEDGPFYGKRKYISGRKLEGIVKNFNLNDEKQELDISDELIIETNSNATNNVMLETTPIVPKENIENKEQTESTEETKYSEEVLIEKRNELEKRILESEKMHQSLIEEKRRIDEEIRAIFGYDPSKSKDKKEFK